jgi:levanbiose-producing levanase
MAVDADPSRTTWVLGTSANGSSSGGTTGYAYWTGRWDGRRFTAERTDPLWLDHGSDFYAGVTWSDPRLSPRRQLAERYAIGWMNNWSYAQAVPALPSTGGPNTLVRRIRLADVDGRPTLRSSPVGLRHVTGRATHGRTGAVSAASTVLRTDRASYRLHVRLRPRDAREVRVVVRAGDGSRMTVGYDAERRQAFLVRDADAVAARMPGAYREVRTAAVDPRADGSVDLDVITDGAATEVYVNRGAATLTSLVFLGRGTRSVRVEPVGGTAVVESAALSPLSG